MLDEGHSGDLYAVLGVGADAEAAALRQAYTRAALRSHPDKNPGDAGAATRFARVNAAYEVLRDESRRGIYDAFGAEGLRVYEGAYALARSGRASARTVLPPVMLVTLLGLISAALALLLGLAAALAALRLDGALVDVPWAAILTPLWLADPLLLFGAALLTADAPGRLGAALARFAPSAALHFLFQLMLCAKLS